MAKQSVIPGTERAVNAKVENAGDLLVSATKKKTKANTDHKKAEDHLLQVMIDEGVDEYVSEELRKTFNVEESKKVKVSTWENPNAAEEKGAKKRGGGEDAH